MGLFSPLRGALRRWIGGEFRILIKNSSWVFLANAFRTLLSFVKSILIARGLGVDLYGTYVIIFAFVSTIQQFLDLNLGTAVIKFGADYRSQGRLDKLVALTKASVMAYGVLGIFSVLAVVAISALAYDTFIEVPGLEMYLILYAVVSSISSINSVSYGILRLFYRFRVNSIVHMVTALVDFIFIAAVIFLFPHQLEPFLIAMIIAKLLDSGIINGAALWEMWGELKGSRRSPIGLIREDGRVVGKFVLGNSGTRTLKTLMDRGDVLLLGALSSSQQVGLYDIAKKLSQTVLRFTDPLTNSIFPQVAKLIAEQRIGEVRNFLIKLSTGASLAVLPVLVLALFFSEQLIVMMYGSDFAPAAWIFFIHLIASLQAAVLFWGLPLIQSLNLITERLRITTIALVVGGILGYLVAPYYGALGVACVLLLVKIIITIDMMGAANKRLHKLSVINL